jgi:hypothetical protein
MLTVRNSQILMPLTKVLSQKSSIKMNYKTISAIFACVAIIFICPSCKMVKSHAVEPNGDGADAKLIEALRNVPVNGPSLGAPAQGLSTNAATEAIVQKGPVIIPTLISALDHSSWTQTVWIVFCLDQLRATGARERILKLQREIDNGRFANEHHDLTLQAIIQAYLTVIDIQPPETNDAAGT